MDCSDSVIPWTVARQAPLVREILQARILEWVAMPSSRGSSQPRDRTLVSCIAVRFFTAEPPGKSIHHILSPQLTAFSNRTTGCSDILLLRQEDVHKSLFLPSTFLNTVFVLWKRCQHTIKRLYYDVSKKPKEISIRIILLPGHRKMTANPFLPI